MKVVRAEQAGACYGVQRALDLATAAVEDGGRACTLGPLIHNPRVVARLESHGVRAVASLEDAHDDETVIIRSHGVTPAVKRAVEQRGLPMVDATCPHVARAQKAAAALARAGMQVIVVGEAGHPEVEGLVAHAREAARALAPAAGESVGAEAASGPAEPCADAAGAGAPAPRVAVVATPDDLPEHIEGPVGVVVQTTQTRAALDAVLEALRARGIEPAVKDTICFATRQRQEAAAALADRVDAFVVIGGRNSSNTTRLADICRARCERTHHVESADELDPAWFADCLTVGVTAGASTPEDQIAAVEEALRGL